MAEEEKESKGSKKLQLQFPIELVEKVEEKAKNAGVTVNQYILYLLIKDAKNPIK